MSLRLATALALSTALTATATVAQDWRAQAEQDLTAIHAALRDNHPAAVIDQDSSTFRSWLDAGLAEARENLGRVNSPNAFGYILRGYAGGFRDANIQAGPSWEESEPWFGVAWPSFATRWENGGYVVSYVAQGVRNTPPLGARLIDCDGTPAAEIANRRLDRYEGNLQLEADRYATAPYLLWDRANPMAGSLPAQCNWQVGNRRRAFPITAVPASAQEREVAYRASVFTPPATTLVVEPWNGGHWIRVHTLEADGAWEAFYAQVESMAEAIRAGSHIVIDLRGVSAGDVNSTAFGYRLANRIWGPDYFVSRQPGSANIGYRVSAANRQWFAEALARMEADPVFVQMNAATIEETRAIVAAFDEAAAAGQQSFTRAGPPALPDSGEPNAVGGQVIILTDGACTQGCLDFVDALLRMPNTRHVGGVTGADSIYIEPTVLTLPSNAARLSYGHKAWLDRSRRSNQPYTPAEGLRFTGNMADDEAVRAFVASVLGAG